MAFKGVLPIVGNFFKGMFSSENARCKRDADIDQKRLDNERERGKNYMNEIHKMLENGQIDSEEALRRMEDYSSKERAYEESVAERNERKDGKSREHVLEVVMLVGVIAFVGLKK